jgi:hypothetical protein
VSSPRLAAAPSGDWYEDVEYRESITRTVGGSHPAGVAGGRGQGKGAGDESSSFFGIESEEHRMVFVVDCSRSMNDPHRSSSGTRFKRLQLELSTVLNALAEGDEFFIIFFNNRPIPMPADSLQRAAPETRARFLEWVSVIHADGSTDPRGAMNLAFNLEPDMIYLLSDGEFKYPVERDLLKIRQRKVVINTISFGTRGGEPVLKTIAERNRGEYRFVP